MCLASLLGALLSVVSFYVLHCQCRTLETVVLDKYACAQPEQLSNLIFFDVKSEIECAGNSSYQDNFVAFFDTDIPQCALVAPPDDVIVGAMTSSSCNDVSSTASVYAVTQRVKDIYSPAVPFTTPIPGGLSLGKTISIIGTPCLNPSRFSVNILCGPSETSDDYSITIEARFVYIHGTPARTVVMNHKEGGNWGSQQEDSTNFPFEANTQFELMIMADEHGFNIYVNNEYLWNFAHQIKIERATHFQVSDEMSISLVRFKS